jgi:hypothetical protein
MAGSKNGVVCKTTLAISIAWPRGRSATVTPLPIGLLSKFNRLMNCPAIAREDADRRLVARRSTRFAVDLAGAPAARSYPPEDGRDQRPGDTIVTSDTCCKHDFAPYAGEARLESILPNPRRTLSTKCLVSLRKCVCSASLPLKRGHAMLTGHREQRQRDGVHRRAKEDPKACHRGRVLGDCQNEP